MMVGFKIIILSQKLYISKIICIFAAQNGLLITTLRLK